MPMPAYPDVPSQPSFPAIEEQMLERWKQARTFERSVDARAAGPNEYVFYDGPPFANGLPHYGHLLTGYVKDVVPRYQTMRGRRGGRRVGVGCPRVPPQGGRGEQLRLTTKTRRRRPRRAPV